MPRNLIDTNLIIRFLTSDDEYKASSVEKLLKSGGNNVLLDVVVAEIVWVLASYYKLDKELIIEKVRGLIHIRSVYCSRKLLSKALLIWEANNISFIDAYIAAKAQINDLVIYSYDRDFDKVVGVVRKEP